MIHWGEEDPPHHHHHLPLLLHRHQGVAAAPLHLQDLQGEVVTPHLPILKPAWAAYSVFIGPTGPIGPIGRYRAL